MYDEKPEVVGTGGGDWVGALINSGAMLYDSYQNRKASKENTDKTIAAQKSESELAYQRQLEMWERQNLYNSPEAQMARFSAAGLNPHLIYGQGTAGNATSFPEYQPANLQYRYEAPAYGSAIQSILPTLMSVGSWMQQMRLSESEIESRRTGTERTRQMIDFLISRNPQLLEEGRNRLSLYPYQRELIDYSTNEARTKLFEMEQRFRYEYGEDLFKDLGSAWDHPRGDLPVGGMKRLQFLEEQSKRELLEAKASWSQFDITDPQALMHLVLNGVMGLAGQTIRLSTHRSPSKQAQPARRSGTLRMHPARRVQASHPYSD